MSAISRRVPPASRQPHRFQPELRDSVFPLGVDMHRRFAVSRVRQGIGSGHRQERWAYGPRPPSRWAPGPARPAAVVSPVTDALPNWRGLVKNRLGTGR